MSADELRKQSSWLIGVIVALVLRESLSRAVPDITSPLHNTPAWIVRLECARLGCVFVTILRYYLGFIDYFGEAHEGRPTLMYGLDFAARAFSDII